MHQVAHGRRGPSASGGLLLFEPIDDRACGDPDAPAIVGAGARARTLSHGELAALSDAIRRALQAAGVRRGALVAIVMHRGWEQIVAALGVLKAGAAYLPIDPGLPAERQLEVHAQAQPAAILTQSWLASSLPGAVGVPRIAVDLLDPAPGPLADAPAERGASTDLAYVMFTSGSTGKPKGVMIDHRGASNTIADINARFRLGPEDRVLALSSLSFDLSVFDIFGVLAAGGAVVLPDAEREREPSHWAELIREHRVTVWNTVPALMEMLVSHLGEEAAPLPLRLVMLSGDWIPVSLPDRVRRVTPREVQVVSLGGATEASIWSIAYPIGEVDPGWKSIPYGKALENQSVRVLDERRRPCPVGQAGRIHIGGAGVALGYYRDPVRTAERFVTDPETGERLYWTGDLGRLLPDGNIEFLGREDLQVKIHGYRIELEEIEVALLRLPGVQAAAVVAFDTAAGGRQLAAFVVPPGGAASATCDVAQLRAGVGDALPGYMVPTRWQVLEALPLTANGKLDRKHLAELARAAPTEAPTQASSHPSGPGDLPLSPTEERIALLFAAVLRIDQEGRLPGRSEDFFAIGGESLLGTQLLYRLRVELGVELPLRTLFEAPTVGLLAERVEEARRRGHQTPERPLRRREAGHRLPRLSFAQQRLWLLDQIRPGSPVYNVAQSVRLAGRLDEAALERSFIEVIRRHEVLRTTFAKIDGEPRQVIAAEPSFSLSTVAVPGGTEAERLAEVSARIGEATRRSFDLARGPLVAATLLRLSPTDHVLVTVMHHAVADAWSLGVMWSELAALYAAFAEGVAPSLAELPIQVADHAEWQRECLAGEPLRAELAWWKQALAGAPSSVELPTARPRPPVPTHRGSAHELQLDAALQAALEALCRREGVTPFMALLAAFQLLLARYSGQDDIVVGTPIAGRTRAETAGLVGCFLNTLALRTRLDGDPTFRQLLARVREVTLGAHAHQDVPFEMLVEQLAPPRDRSQTPLFNVYFNMLNADMAWRDLPGLAAVPWREPEAVAKFDLDLYAEPRDGRLVLSLVPSDDLFSAVQGGAMRDHLEQVLRAAVADPDLRVAAFPLLLPTACARPSVVVKGVPGPDFTPFSESATASSITRRFDEQVRRHGARTAVRTATGDVSYAALAARVDRIAGAVGPGGGRVVLMFEPGAASIAAVFGVLKAGAAYVPLDLASPPARLASILEDAAATTILTHGPCLSRARALAPGGCRLMDVDALDDAGPGAAPPNPTPPDADQVAYVLFTSGSTGRPKGVVQTHRNVLLHIRNYANRLFISPSDVIPLVATYASDAGVMDLFGALLSGATLCPIDVMKDGLRHLPRLLRERGVTFFHSTPTVYRHLVGGLAPGEVMEGIRRVVLGGEEARRSDVEAFRAHFPADSILVNGLGPTESSLALQYHVDHTTSLDGEALPVGFPVDGVEVTLENALGEQVAVHGPGEIVLRGSQVALGYWRPEERRVIEFPHDAALPTRRVYRTGDLARRLEGGALEYLGRIDHQVKIHGHRIELGEIEAALARHPAVRQCAVVARQDDKRGRRLVAYVAAARPDPSLSQALRAHLVPVLPNYMVPSTFVVLDALPMLPNGKVDRRALPPPPEGPDAPRAEAKPRRSLEFDLVRIFEGVLGVAGIGVDSNFFELGGDSLLAVKLFDRVEKACGVNLPLACLFEAPTVGALAELLGQQGFRPRWQSLVPIQTAGRRPPFFCVHAVGGNVLNYRLLSRHLGDDQPFYGLQSRGLDGQVAPYANVAEMAAAYLAEIRQLQPEGPYQIGGASSGGVIAYEMAQQLVASGQVVSRLILVDTRLDQPRPSRAAEAEAASPLHRRAMLLDVHFGHLLLRSPREGLRYLAERAQERIEGMVGPVGKMFQAATPAVRDVIQHNRRAANEYVPRPYPGSAVMLLCRDSASRVFYDGRLTWADLVEGGLTVRFIPGEHNDMFDEPAVAGAAAVLDRCLAR